MKMIKIIDRKLNIVELPCGKWCNSLDLDKLDCINTVGNIIVKYNLSFLKNLPSTLGSKNAQNVHINISCIIQVYTYFTCDMILNIL